MFIEKNERLLIMDLAGLESLGYTALQISDFRELERVGVRTISFEGLAQLDVDWNSLYYQIDNVLRNTNLKILLSFWRTPPKDATWLLGVEIDYGNPTVGKSIDETTLRFLDGLGNNRDRVQLTYGYGSSGGEVDWMHYPYRLLPGTIGESDRHAELPPVSDERVAEFVVERQKILSAQHNEVWTSFLNTMVAPQHPRRMIIDNALYDAYPDCTHYRLQHWYFPSMSNEVSRRHIRNNPKSKYFVGSEHVPGLESNYAAGMEQGAWGFITAPIHIHAGASKLDSGMLTIIENAIKRLSNEN